MHTIETSIGLAIPITRVRPAVTTEAGFRGWLAGDTDVIADHVTFRFSVPEERRSVTFRIDRIDETGIAMTCVAHEHNPDWLGTTLAISLHETPTGTRVELVHAGYAAKNEVFERCNEAWPHFLRSLASFMMTGTGEPFPKAA
jgi:uncharacterized protein YndB with AHSA1/START domain